MSLPFLTPAWPGLPANVAAISTLRAGGVSRAPYHAPLVDNAQDGGLNLGVHVADRPEDVQENRLRLQSVLPSQPVWLTQVHGVAVLDAAGAGQDAPAADASFSAQPGVVCVIMTADCLPVLFTDRQGRVVAAAHAGWRGLADGVLGRTVEAMRQAGAGDILAWLGPAIGPARFEVGQDVLDAFQRGAPDAVAAAEVRAAFVPLVAAPGKYLADIYALARHMLGRHGVTDVSGGQYCTVSDPARFYSYRRDGVTGRQASLIWRK